MSGETTASSKPTDKTVTEINDLSRQLPETVARVERQTSVGGLAKETALTTPSNTPTNSKALAANSGTAPPPSSYSMASDVARKEGSSTSQQETSDVTKKTTNPSNQLAQSGTAGILGVSLPNHSVNDNGRMAEGVQTQPQASKAASTPMKGPLVLTPVPLSQAHPPPPKPKNETDLSVRIMNSFGAKEDDSGRRTTPKDNSPSRVMPIESQQTSVVNSENNARSASVVTGENNARPAPVPHMPSLRQNFNETKTSTHRATQSLQDFDPMSAHYHISSNSESMLPVLSLQSSYSLGAVPINSENAMERMASTNLNGTFLSRNPFVVPVAFEVAPASVGVTSLGNEMSPSAVTSGQTVMTNGLQGFQQQHFMVVSHQQPIMFQQIGTGVQSLQDMNGGHWGLSTTLPIPNQGTNYPQGKMSVGPLQQAGQNPQQPLPSHYQLQTTNHQHPKTQNQKTPSNPFDPLSNR